MKGREQMAAQLQREHNVEQTQQQSRESRGDKHKNNFANNKRHISAARWHDLCKDNCNLQPIQM